MSTGGAGHAGLSPEKARRMLHEGRASGRPLTDRQRRYFGHVASMAHGGRGYASLLDRPLTFQYGGSGYSGYGSEYVGAHGAPAPEVSATRPAGAAVGAAAGTPSDEDYYERVARLSGTDPERERYEFLVSRMEAGTPFENFEQDAQQFLRDYHAKLQKQQRDAEVRRSALDQAIEAVAATNPDALSAGYTPEQLADIQYRIGMEVEQGGYDPEGEYQRLRQAQAEREALGTAEQYFPQARGENRYVRTARGNYIERPEETGLTDKILGPAGKVLGGAARSALDTPLASVAAGLNPLTAPFALGAEAARRLGLVEGPGGPTVADVPPAAYEAYMYDIPVVSPFMRETVQPVAGDVGEFLAEQAVRSYLPFGLEAVSDAIGLDFVSGAGEAGETAGEALTPITAGDIAVSLLIPATADWADVYRAAKGAGLIDELGRVARGSVLRNLAQEMGRSADDVARALGQVARRGGDAVARGSEALDDSLLRAVNTGQVGPVRIPQIGGPARGGTRPITLARPDAVPRGDGIVYSNLSPTEVNAVIRGQRANPVYVATDLSNVKVQGVPDSGMIAFQLRPGARPLRTGLARGAEVYRPQDLEPVSFTPETQLFDAATIERARPILAGAEAAALRPGTEAGYVRLPSGAGGDMVVVSRGTSQGDRAAMDALGITVDRGRVITNEGLAAPRQVVEEAAQRQELRLRRLRHPTAREEAESTLAELHRALETPGAGRAASDLAPPPSAAAPPAAAEPRIFEGTITVNGRSRSYSSRQELERLLDEAGPRGEGLGGPPTAPPEIPPDRADDFGDLIPQKYPRGVETAREIAEAKIPKVMSVEAGQRPSVIRRTVGVAVPGLKYPRPVLVANSASDAVHAQITSWVEPQLEAARAVQDAFDAARPIYRGTARTPDVGTAVHFLENPWDYENVSPALEAARRQWDQAFDAGLRRLADEYGVQIDPYYPRGPRGERGSYVPHMESIEETKARKAAGEVGPEPELRSTARVSIEKERGIPTVSERLTYDPTFEPELDLATLAQRHAAQLNEAAARTTYSSLIGGKTGSQLMEEAHPELLKLRKDLTRQVRSARQSLRNVSRIAETNERLARQTDTRIRNLQGRIGDMAARVEGLGDEYGPELSYLSGELRQLNRQLSSLQGLEAGQVDKVIKNLERANDVFTEYAAKMTDLDDLRRVVRTTNTKRVVDENGKVVNYVFDRITNRWVRPDVARASQAISRNKVAAPIELLEDVRAVQLNSGDLSPLTFGRAQMGVFGYLGSAPHSLKHAASALLGGDKWWRGVDQNMLETFQGLRGRRVTQPIAELRPVEAGRAMDEGRRGLERIPKLGTAIRAVNDHINRFATAGEFMAWETATRSILRRKPELSLAEAGAEAMKAMDNIAPRIDLTRYGFSKAAARTLNAPMTSVSYMLSAPNFTANFTGAGVKLMAELGKHAGNPIAAWRALGAADQETLIHGIELIGTITALSGMSAALFDDRAGYSVEEKVKQAINPLDGNFWKIHLGGGYSIPIAAPLRSGIRMAVRTVQNDPRAPLDYAANRFISAPRFLYGLAFNRDWTGDEIITEDHLLGQLREIGLYALEQANITTSPAFRAIRTGSASVPGQGGSIRDVIGETVVSQLGFNIYEPSVWRQRDDQVMSDIETGATYTDAYGNEKPYPKTYIDADGNEQPVRSYRDLRAASPLAADDFDAKHGDLAAAADELRSETSQRIRTLQEEFRGRQEARDARLLDEDPAEWREQSSEDASRTSAAIEERALDFGGELDVETQLDEVLEDYGAAIEEATTDTGAVDWLAVDRYVAQLSDEERTLLLEARMRGETEVRKQYYRDLEQHMVPYFEVRDKEWAKLQRQNPERFGDYASADQFRIAERKRLEAQGMPPLVAEDLANTIVETATAGADVESTVYLLRNPETIAMLQKWGFYVPADLKPLSPTFAEQLQPTR